MSSTFAHGGVLASDFPVAVVSDGPLVDVSGCATASVSDGQLVDGSKSTTAAVRDGMVCWQMCMIAGWLLCLRGKGCQ